MSVIAFLMACGGNTEQNQTTNSAETVLTPSKTVNQDYMIATGENVIFFVPSADRIEAVKESNPNIDSELVEFKKVAEEAKEELQDRGISFFDSEEASFKLMITEKQFFIINAAGVKKGYGVAMSKLNKQPQVIQGMVSIDELMQKVDEFYK